MNKDQMIVTDNNNAAGLRIYVSKETNLDMSIVVLNWNTSDLLGGALESIVSTAGSIHYEVVVIDNASTDGGLSKVPDTIRQDARFRFIQNEKNLGWAAINIMLEKTKAKYIVTVDPDAILHSRALQELHAFMETHPDAGAATASLFNVDGSPQLYYRRIMTPSIFFFTTIFGRLIDKYMFRLRHFSFNRYENLDVSRTQEVEQPAWPCLVWRREALGAYIVDAHIPFYFVDVDMSKRIYDRGYKIYLVATSTITHLKSTSFGKTNNSWRKKEYNRSLQYYFKKHYPKQAPFLIMLLQLDVLCRWALRRLTGRELLQ